LTAIELLRDSRIQFQTLGEEQRMHDCKSRGECKMLHEMLVLRSNWDDAERTGHVCVCGWPDHRTLWTVIQATVNQFEH